MLCGYKPNLFSTVTIAFCNEAMLNDPVVTYHLLQFLRPVPDPWL